MKNVLLLTLTFLCWGFSTINCSGWGLDNNTPDLTIAFIVVWYLFEHKKNKFNDVLHFSHVHIILTLVSFIIIPFLMYDSFEGARYLSMVPLVYCFSKQKPNDWSFHISGYIIAGLGLFILYLFKNTDLIAGWDENEVAMIGLFSYFYFTISFYGRTTFKKVSIGALITVLYVMFLSYTNCRSSLLFIIIAIVFVYIPQLKKMVVKNYFLHLTIQIPLLIAIIVAYFPQMEIFREIELYSQSEFGKTAFSGRDNIWRTTFYSLPEYYFLGNGKFLINHHNSAVAVLGVFGIVGYFCWIKYFLRPIKYMAENVNDNLVYGCLISFMLIFLQQSFDLGFVNASPNMIPYMILGLGMARAKNNVYGTN